MPDYSWSCFACGCANKPEVSRCKVCLCPASCNTKVMREHQRKFVAEGGIVGPAAVPALDTTDYAVLKILLALPLLVLGWWPFKCRKTQPNESVLADFLGD